MCSTQTCCVPTLRYYRRASLFFFCFLRYACFVIIEEHEENTPSVSFAFFSSSFFSVDKKIKQTIIRRIAQWYVMGRRGSHRSLCLIEGSETPTEGIITTRIDIVDGGYRHD